MKIRSVIKSDNRSRSNRYEWFRNEVAEASPSSIRVSNKRIENDVIIADVEANNEYDIEFSKTTDDVDFKVILLSTTIVMNSDSFADWDDDSIDINVSLTVIKSKNFLTRKK